MKYGADELMIYLSPSARQIINSSDNQSINQTIKIEL